MTGFSDSPRTTDQHLPYDKHMKSFLILTLALSLLAGCSGKKDQATVQTNPGLQSDPGTAFLAENAKKDGVITTASGLQYKVIKSGTGGSPKLTDTVKVHYQGTLIDGTVFDSSIQRGQPVSFPVGQVIPGWVEALQMMKVGDKWQLFIPARLAYGDQSPSPAIPPNSVLIFEVELLGIEK
jgi:FKBP-type peptidyl-prolyl cis-trans isomerase FklB